MGSSTVKVSRLWRVLAGVVAGLLATAEGAPRDQPASDVERWMKDRWCSGRGCIPEGDGYISLRVEHPAEAPLEEVERVLREVEGKPDHPRRAWAERQLARHENGAHVEEVEFWRLGRSWRYSETYREGDGTIWFYVDRVSTPDVTWSISAKDLHIADPTRPPTGKGDWYRDPGVALELLTTACMSLFHGRLGAMAAETPQPEIVVFEDGNGWLATVQSPGGWSLRYRVERSGGGADEFVIRSMESFQTDSEGTRRKGRTEFSSEMLDTPWGPAYRSVEWINEGGMARRRYVLVAASADLPSDVKSYFELPAVDGEDPIRGKVTVASVFDYRPGRGRLTQVESGVAISSRPLQGAPGSGLSIRVVGWIAAGVIAATLVFLRLRKRAAR